jgi:pentatricopeptide repeat protein
LKPNVRTYTALLTALGNAARWGRAVALLFTMQRPDSGGVQVSVCSVTIKLVAGTATHCKHR